MTTAAAPIYELKDVIRVYREEGVETIALRGVDLTVGHAEYVAVMGRSGSGKSTLLGLLSGSDRPTAGRVAYRGRDLGSMDDEQRAKLRGREIGVVFQAQNLFRVLSLVENVVFSAGLAGRAISLAEARSHLADAGVVHRGEHRPETLSGGEQQRAALACVLAARPSVLLADEITGELDSTSASILLDLVGRANERDGTTIVLVTHDPSVAARAGRVVQLRDGRVAAGADATA